MNATVEIVNECGFEDLPGNPECAGWVSEVLDCVGHKQASSVSIAFVSAERSASLNAGFRGKQGATNVLSFSPAVDTVLPDELTGFLGDIVLCPDIVMREAEDQGKTIRQHMTHLVVHGCLHLLGYEHDTEEQATLMEGLEIKSLRRLGLPNPYLLT